MTVNFESSENAADGEESAAEFVALRELLIGPEQRRLDELSDELHSTELSPEELADRLPEAIALRGSRDDQLGRALGPTIETAMRESIRRNPEEMATAIFPILGPAIRKAIAETMAALVRSINAAVEQSLSVNGIKWRIEAWRTGVPYPEIVIRHALVYRVEQVFLVHAETGLLLEHVAAQDLQIDDADLISSMMSAIGDFVRDSFRPGEGATLRTFSVGEHTVQVEAGPRALLAVVIRGQAPDSLLLRQQDTLETIHLEYASQLADFSGDSEPFESARPLLATCLETVLVTQSKEARERAWMRWALPLLFVVLVIAAFWVRSSMRWNAALKALRAEPGLVVVDASRGLRNWTISGMKDPIARDPRVVIAGAGISPPALSGRWQRFLSLDPEIVAARQRHSVDSLRQLVDGERVLFDAGSADLSPSAVVRLAETAPLIRQLEQATLAAGGVRVELTGRADPTGPDVTNTALAQTRVANVARWLESAGIDSSRLIPNPIATARPLMSTDPAERARINRSVSFKVTASAAPSPQGGQ